MIRDIRKLHSFKGDTVLAVKGLNQIGLTKKVIYNVNIMSQAIDPHVVLCKVLFVILSFKGQKIMFA